MYESKGRIQQLAEYILKNLSKGYTLDSLRVALTNQGYSKISIDNGIKKANKILAEKAPIMEEKPEIIYRLIESASSEEATAPLKEKIVYEETYIPEKKSFWKKLKEIFFGE